MKPIAIAALSAMLLSAATAPAALADKVSLGSGELPDSPPVTPSALVSQGYRGLLDNMPGYTRFVSEYQRGHITAEDLVQAAIAAGRLEPSSLEDAGYLAAVEMQLEGLPAAGGR